MKLDVSLRLVGGGVNGHPSVWKFVYANGPSRGMQIKLDGKKWYFDGTADEASAFAAKHGWEVV